MHTSNYIYHHGTLELHGFLAFDEQKEAARPAVLVVHDWTGRNEFACDKAKQLAEMGYLGFAVDLYGEGRLGDSIEEKQAFMGPLANDRQLLKNRIQAALDTVTAMAEVDITRIAVIGFCFGGLCALDLARSGAEVAGVVSFHGLLGRPESMPKVPIHAKILALHGYDDPMVPPEQVEAFCQEMTETKADWQVHLYGHTQHAFTNPNAHDQTLGTIYHPQAANRAWQTMSHFLNELFTV